MAKKIKAVIGSYHDYAMVHLVRGKGAAREEDLDFLRALAPTSVLAQRILEEAEKDTSSEDTLYAEID